MLEILGVFDIECKDLVCDFVSDYVKVAKYEPNTSLLNYDLLKSSLLMIAFLGVDVDRANLFPTLLATRDLATGAILRRLTESHFRDMAGEHLKIIHDLKALFIKSPTYENALEYYFNSLLIRTGKSAEFKKVRELLIDIHDKPEHEDHYIGGKKSFIYYNISKILSAAKRDDHVEEKDMDMSPGVDAMVARRFKHHLKLA